MEQQLCLFGRDEVASWMTIRARPWTVDIVFRQSVAANIDGVVKRAETMACKNERENVRLFFPGCVSTNVTNSLFKTMGILPLFLLFKLSPI